MSRIAVLVHAVVVAAAFWFCCPRLSDAAPAPASPPPEVAPASPDARYWTIRERALHSGDPRLRILFHRPLLGTEGSAPPRDVIALDSLVDAARGSTEPLTLQLLVDRCRGEAPRSRPCDPVALARRWVDAETRNVVAWVTLATVLREAGDEDAADAAWDGAGRASTMRDAFTDVTRLLAASLASEPDPSVRGADLGALFGLAMAVPTFAFQDLHRGCKASSRREICTHIASVMFRDATTLFSLQFAASLGERLGEPASLSRARRQTVDAFAWANASGAGALLAGDAGDAGAIRTLGRFYANGEVRSGRDRLTERHVAESDAARRWRTSMASLGREPPRERGGTRPGHLRARGPLRAFAPPARFRHPP